jgi:peroxiredoxin
LVGLRDLAHSFPEVRIYAISRDRPEESRELQTKIESDKRGPLGYAMLSDPQSLTIDRYGLRDPEYAKQKLDGIPRPSVLVLDQEGRIRWVTIETDYRQRPSIEEVAAALDAFE